MTEFEINTARWREHGEQNHWTLPPPAPWPLRLPIIRQLRAAWGTWQVERHYEAFAPLGLVRTGYDEWVLWAIARGMC